MSTFDDGGNAWPFGEDQMERMKRNKSVNCSHKKKQAHSGDCSIYSALINGSPTDGICTCGYGAQQLAMGS